MTDAKTETKSTPPASPAHATGTAATATKSLLPEFKSIAGWLNKEGQNWRTWKRRYFVLHGLSLIYYETPEEGEAHQTPKGALMLDGNWAVMDADKKTQKPCSFEISSTKRSMLVIAEDEKTKNEWMEAIRFNIAYADRQRSRAEEVETLKNAVGAAKKQALDEKTAREKVEAERVEELKKQMDETTKLKNDLKTRDENLKKLTDSTKDMEDRIKQQQEVAEQLRGELKQRDDTAHEMSEKHDALEKQVQALKADLAKAQRALAAAQAQAGMSKAELEEAARKEKEREAKETEERERAERERKEKEEKERQEKEKKDREADEAKAKAAMDASSTSSTTTESASSSSSTSSTSTEAVPAINMEADIQVLRAGIRMTKVPTGWGKPTEHVFTLVADKKTSAFALQYDSTKKSPEEAQMVLKDCVFYPDQQHGVFSSQKVRAPFAEFADRSFSLVNKKRSMDCVCKTTEEMGRIARVLAVYCAKSLD